MSDTVKHKTPLLRPSPVPSRAVIRKRMADRFGGFAPLMWEIVEPCAEEAERIMLDLLSGKIEAATVTITGKRHGSSGRIRKGGYQCSSCRKNNLHFGDNYCAGCGIKLEWR